ncbi:MAG: hypothetical protein OEM93_17470, partial [Rhodospirillales bacterium]|nr:hypothetical protein [Rhodospirillales bacterium]
PELSLPFEGVRWGSRHARADTLANLAGRRVALIEPLDDVDTVADLAHLKRQKKVSETFSTLKY